MTITIITDNTNSWFLPFGKQLQKKLLERKYSVFYVNTGKEIRKGDICFILSCSKIIKEKYLKLNKNNIVVHASDLPSGKGFSPLQWQVLNGNNEIILTLFEAVKDVDAGPYYIKRKLFLKETDLLDEMQKKTGDLIIKMCLEYVDRRDVLLPIEQTGQESFFRKRDKKDDEIDINKTIKEQFNHFRIADNKRFPLHFTYLGKKYILKIYKDE